MKKLITFFFVVLVTFVITHKLFSQSASDMRELGISAGTFTNFPANQNYLKDDITVFYLAPYIRTGNHEFSAGPVYPLKIYGLFFNTDNINPQVGAVARYKYYIFNVYGRENLFVHYSFQYLRFKGPGKYFSGSPQTDPWTETDTYINNTIGLGYNLFLDMNGRFGFYYTLDYVISQTGYKLASQGINNNSWTANYVWNNLSTHMGLLFKITSLKKGKK